MTVFGTTITASTKIATKERIANIGNAIQPSSQAPSEATLILSTSSAPNDVFSLRLSSIHEQLWYIFSYNT